MQQLYEVARTGQLRELPENSDTRTPRYLAAKVSQKREKLAKTCIDKQREREMIRIPSRLVAVAKFYMQSHMEFEVGGVIDM